jgi:hypothetical protein
MPPGQGPQHRRRHHGIPQGPEAQHQRSLGIGGTEVREAGADEAEHAGMLAPTMNAG